VPGNTGVRPSSADHRDGRTRAERLSPAVFYASTSIVALAKKILT
jgi:hypothetical protein